MWYTIKEHNYIKANYEEMTDRQIGHKIGRSETSVCNYRARHGWRKSHKRNAGTFKKGQTPWNKGQSHPARGRAKETQFKKGNLPTHTKYDGAISIWTDSKTGRKYKYIRLQKSKWEPYHRYLWKQTFGPIEKGMVIIFKDDDTMNTSLSNLDCITRAENVRRNSNRKKASKRIKEIWRNEKIRIKYNLPTKTKWGDRLQSKSYAETI